MKLSNKLNRMFRAPQLTRTRMALALAVAMAADGLQFGTLGAPPFGEIIDVIAMILVSGFIGFHLLLLPTFVVEFIPLVDALPTWTACTAAVIAMRKREQRIKIPPALPGSNELEVKREK